MSYPFLPARHFTKTGGRQVDLLVLHDMEAPEIPGTATRVALWFAGTLAPNASAHFCIDDEATIQCVREEDVAWHAPGANHNGIGIEHAGFAHQTAANWSDAYSSAMLERSAQLAADLCRRYDIPAVWLSVADLRAGRRGITSHANVSLAFGKSTHTDPGAHFPAERYVAMVRAQLGGEKKGWPAVGEYVDMIPRPDMAGVWALKADGGVFNDPPGGPFFDSEAERFGKEGRTAARIYPFRGGYVIADDGTKDGVVRLYAHPDPAWKG